MKRWFFLALIAATIAWQNYEPPAKWEGSVAPGEPVQGAVPAQVQNIALGSFQLTPLATYSVTGVVLSRSRYRIDAAAEIAPVDLALGWGPMSAAQPINALKISQSGRWYEYRWGAEGPPLDEQTIIRNSANTHCIPATPEIRSKLLSVRRHDVVSMSGYLVEVHGPRGYNWRSSLSREDTQGGSCEVFCVTSLDSRPPP